MAMSQEYGTGSQNSRDIVRLRLALGVALSDSCRVNEGPAYSSSSNLFDSIVGGYPKGIKAALYRFQHRFRFDFGSNPGRSAVLNVDGRADADLPRFAKRLHCVKGGKLHQANHVRRGIHGRQIFVVGGQSVLELYSLLRFTTDSKRNWFRHAKNVSNRQP